jgi:hypothetical protein
MRLVGQCSRPLIPIGCSNWKFYIAYPWPVTIRKYSRVTTRWEIAWFSAISVCLKGLVHEMVWEICWHAWVNLGQNKSCGRFLNFRCSPIQNFYFLGFTWSQFRFTIYQYSIASYLSRQQLPIGWRILQMLHLHIWIIDQFYAAWD